MADERFAVRVVTEDGESPALLLRVHPCVVHHQTSQQQAAANYIVLLVEYLFLDVPLLYF